MADRQHDLVRHLGASLSRRAGLATLAGAAAAVIGFGDIDAKKKKKKKKKKKGNSVCASGCTYSTLQAAITASPAGSTICLQGGTYTESVAIGKSLTINPCDPTNPVTIQGSGSKPIMVELLNDSDVVRLDGLQPGGLIFQGQGSNYDGGVIQLNTPDSTTTKGNLEIQNVVVSNGNAINGGGIYAKTSGTVHLKNSRISSCSASSSGGGIYMVAGELIMDGTSQINGCNAPQGAGVLLENAAILTLSDSAMIGGTTQGDKNDAYGTSPGEGGGIYAKDGTTVNMADTASIRYNVAGNNGGGIFAEMYAILNQSANCNNIGPSGTIKDNAATNGTGPQIYHANTASIC